MKRIIKSRSQGKTYELIKISAKEQIPILCVNNSSHLVKELAEKMDLKIPHPIEYKHLCLRQYQDNKPILVDNAEYVLQQILRRPIYALSVNKPIEIKKEEVADRFCLNMDDFEIVE